jgi:putative membrane protein
LDADKLALILRNGWDIHPTLLLALGALVGLYILGARRARRSAGERLSFSSVFWFGSAILSLFLILNSPLHHLSDDYLFSAHMAQHLLLTLLVPPLLLAGIPGWMLRGIEKWEWLRRLASGPQYYVVAFAVFHVPFTLVHFPVLYDAAFGTELSHRIMHVLLFVTAVITWLPLMSPVPEVLPRLSQAARMLYCFAQTLPGQLVGALLTLSDQVLFRKYAMKSMELGVPPVTDQQVGGLLMWVIGGTYWLVVLTVIFFIWADREEAHAYG